MTKGQNLIRIDCLIYQEMADSLNEVFKHLALPEIFIRSARAVVFREKHSRFFNQRNKLKLEESPIQFFTFYLPPEHELKILSFIADKADLTIPGRGSVFSTPVTIYRKTPLVFNEEVLGNLPQPSITPSKNLTCLVAIVNRGEGNDLAKALLQTGRALPVITYGTGVGLRDKLGLLRITISAEKEIVQALVASHDAEANFNRMAEAANLDYPGKGFLYSYPVSGGILDTRMIRGRAFYLASMEQIVSAIDTMKGHSEWRRDSPLRKLRGLEKRATWDNLRILSRESMGHEKTQAVMNLGAGGATQCRLRYYDPGNETDRTISHEREINDLVISEETRNRIFELIDEGEDIIELSPVDRISAFRQTTKKKEKSP
ncbi:MAG: hypothetical protein LBK44_06475 [Spirochaetales bacterium]|jgi:hypothetical protein|nr:hypothetical protein [Spirochaetales bacterium]